MPDNVFQTTNVCTTNQENARCGMKQDVDIFKTKSHLFISLPH